MNIQEKIVAQNVLKCKQKWSRLTDGQRNFVSKFKINETVSYEKTFVMKIHKGTPEERLIFPRKEIPLSQATIAELNKLHRIATDK